MCPITASIAQRRRSSRLITPKRSSLDAELVGCAGLALANALDLGSVEGIQLPAALALLLRPDLVGARERPFKQPLEVSLACDLPADVADDPTEPNAQEAQLAVMPVELLGVCVAPRHHRGPLGDAQIGLSQPYSVPADEAIEPLDGGMQQLGVGRKRDGLGLHGGVDRDPLEIPRAQRAGLVRDPQALG